MKKRKKVLFVATVDSHIELFHLPYLKMFHDKGYEVHVATDTNKPIKYCDKKICLPIKRSPFKLVSNMRAVHELKKVMMREGYEIVHCHTPMGGVVARMAGRKTRKRGTRMIYTAHGFHFYTGAPVHYWLMFYPVEWYLAKYTDTLITINNEDYERAKKRFGKRCRDIQYVSGVGVDEKKFAKKMSAKEKSSLRKSLGLRDDDKVLIFPAELSKRKNQMWLIKTLESLFEKDKAYHLLLPGKDSLNGKCQKLVKDLRLEKQIHFLGFRNDIPELMQISNVAVSSARQEGLPVNLIEAAMLGLPIVATDCRGNRDICEKASGMIVRQGDDIGFTKGILKVLTRRVVVKNLTSLWLDNVEDELSKIYFRKKRVLHVLASNIFSGAENVACMIIRNLSNEFDMAYCSPEGPIEKKLKEINIKYYPICKLNYSELKRIIKQYNPDIIHAHDYRASLMASKFSKCRRIISHIHLNNPKVRRFGLWSFLYQKSVSAYEKVIWVSEDALRDYYYARREIVVDKSVVLRNVVDKKYVEFRANEYGVDEYYDLVFIGRLSDQKNPERAIEVVHLLKKQKEDIRLAMLGDGEEKDIIKSLINRYGLKNNVKMFGFVENPYPILNNSRVLLMTSKYEGTPMVVLEAQALNKPVVSTKIDGLKELVKNGENGFLANGNEELVDDIMEIIGSDGGYNFFSRNVELSFSRMNSFNEYMSQILFIYGGGDRVFGETVK